MTRIGFAYNQKPEPTVGLASAADTDTRADEEPPSPGERALLAGRIGGRHGLAPEVSPIPESRPPTADVREAGAGRIVEGDHGEESRPQPRRARRADAIPS